MIKRLSIILLLVLVALVAFPVMPVHAIADPDTAPQVSAVYVYEFSDGSVGVLIDYYLDYAVLPDETATEAYLAVFVDTDGTTQLKSVAPYTFVDSGYGRGLVWISFSTAEAATYSLDSANVSDYRIWLTGNPTLDWDADPPKTITTIDQWVTTSVTETLASRVLYYADVLEIAWTLDMIEATTLGNRLTSVGESYFDNVISGLRILAPTVYSQETTEPVTTELDYTTEFGATVTSGTATIAGSPVTLVAGTNTVDTGATTGTFTVTIVQGTSGTLTNNTGTATDAPIDLYLGESTITVTGAGTFDIVVGEDSVTGVLDASVTGTGWDLTDVAAVFGMSRWWFSGLVWMLLTVVACGGLYASGRNNAVPGEGVPKIIFPVFVVMSLIGVLLGMVKPIVGAYLFISGVTFAGYIFILRNGSTEVGNKVSFFAWVTVGCMIAGTLMVGYAALATTRLSADLSDNATTINVESTTGFPNAGTIQIGDERIAYGSLTATTFRQTLTRPLTRGVVGTENVAHLEGAAVRLPETGIVNNALSYNINTFVDAAGRADFIQMVPAVYNLISTVMSSPWGFLGEDGGAIITIFWGAMLAGLVVSLFVALRGGR